MGMDHLEDLVYCRHSGGVLEVVLVAMVVELVGPLVLGQAHQEVLVDGAHSWAVTTAELILFWVDEVVIGLIGPAYEIVVVDYEPINGPGS